MARVKFVKSSAKFFFEKIQSQTNFTYQKLAKICNVHRRSFSDWKNSRYLVPLSVFKRLVEISNFDAPKVKILPEFWHIKNAAKKGSIVRYKKYGNFGTFTGRSRGGKTTCQRMRSNPLLAKRIGFIVRKKINYPKKSPKLAELMGVLIGDGGISDYQTVVTLNRETDREYVFYVVKLFKNLFNLKSALKERKDEKTYEVVVSSRNLVEYLIKLGLKKGNKIKQQIDIPDWIKRKNKLKIACLRGLIDTDGSFYVDTHKIKNKYYFNPGIDFTSYSSPLFLSVKRILKDLKYHPTGEKKHIRLRRENEIIRYFKEIGPANYKHVSKFKNFMRIHRGLKDNGEVD